MSNSITSYLLDKDNAYLYEQTTQSVPYNSVLIAPPAAGEGYVAVWETSLCPKKDIDFGKGGTGEWEVKKDNREVDLYHGKDKYTLGEDIEGNSYNGVGDIPEWLSAEPTPPTPEEIEEQKAIEERMWRDVELRRADIELNKVQDGDSRAVGTMSDWSTYRNELRDWPENEGFPNSEHRPIAPDAT